MKFCLSVTVFIFTVVYCVNGQSTISDAKIDVKELKCLVCQKSIEELNKLVNALDPNIKVDVGGHRLDADGNYKRKSVPQSKSEVHLSELMEGVCGKMDNYVRALWKSNGTLTLFAMITDDGMNPIFNDVDLVQDEDLNKSLKYYCEEIVAEHEETLIKLYQEEATDIQRIFCADKTSLCPPSKNINVEL